MTCETCNGAGLVAYKAAWETEIGTIVCHACAGSGCASGIPVFLIRPKTATEKVLEKTFYEKAIEPPKTKFRVRRKGY